MLFTAVLLSQQDTAKQDSCKTKLKDIKVQQREINEKLDSVWVILKIDTTKRKK